MPEHQDAFTPAERFEPRLGEDPRRDIGSRLSLRLAWFILLVLIGATVTVQGLGGRSAAKQAAQQQAPAVGIDDPPGGLLEMFGRYVLGAHRMVGGAGSGGPGAAQTMLEPLDQFAHAGGAASLRAAVVAAEVAGPDAAIDRLRALAQDAKTSDATRADAEALIGVYESDDRAAAVAALDPTFRDALRDRHGWFGELALSAGLQDSDPLRAAALNKASRTVVSLIIAIATVGGVGLIGLALLIVGVVRFGAGRMTTMYHPPAPGGSVYLETLAVFLLGFLAIIPLGAIAERYLGVDVSEGLVWLLLLAPFWPVVRGTPWRKHRYAMGWHAGRGVFREIGAGLTGYVAGLPIFGVGVLLLLVLAFAERMIRQALGMPEGEPMSHPIVNEIGQGGWWGTVKLLLLAAVWAPLAEESVFRGAFYHHLRGRLRPIISGMLVAFVFAVIHPQGIVAIPALMALAVVFGLIREWRGSLIGPIVAHALHNAALVLTMTFAMT